MQAYVQQLLDRLWRATVAVGGRDAVGAFWRGIALGVLAALVIVVVDR